MNVALLVGVLRVRAGLRSHDRWSRAELLGHQARALGELRRFAIVRSPFYRHLHRGFEDAPLEALPVVTKGQVMERFDEVVTDRDIRLADAEAHLDHASATDTFRGRYRVAATAGTTGRRGVFLADPAEWRTLLASYSRAYDWAGIAAGLTKRLRMAVVSSRHPSHQSSLIRYELSDRVKAIAGTCPDGLPYGLLGGVEGREEEVLTLAGVIVHPNVFHAALERVEVSRWQVIDEGGRLRVLLARPAPSVDPSDVGQAVATALEHVGAHGITIDAQIVDRIPRTALGKAPLVRRAPGDAPRVAGH